LSTETTTYNCVLTQPKQRLYKLFADKRLELLIGILPVDNLISFGRLDFYHH
jgi:hypothetical protein